MKKNVLWVLSWFMIVVLAAPLEVAPPGAFAQDNNEASIFSQAELDQLLAPIALYPDSLLAQILVAATYPLEVVEADRWVNRNRNLNDEEFNDALDAQDWDLSVKALVPFPQVLGMMSENLDWTRKLGDAFLAQQDDVMDTVQELREEARAEGNLRSTQEQNVVVERETIIIEPADTELVYVPLYDPVVVYGAWRYPAYPPYRYYPRGYAGGAAVFSFAAGAAVGAAWNSGWGQWNWHRHEMNVNMNRATNINRGNLKHMDVQTGKWQHDISHRKGVVYRDPATAGRFAQPSVHPPESRRVVRGFDENRQAGTGAGGVAGKSKAEAGQTGGAQRVQTRESAFSGASGGGRERAAGERGKASRSSSITSGVQNSGNASQGKGSGVPRGGSGASQGSRSASQGKGSGAPRGGSGVSQGTGGAAQGGIRR
jgi:hypothetical protein